MNQQLIQIYKEDIADRNNKISNKELDQRDGLRKIQVQKILDRMNVLDAQDYHHSALIFQHGESEEDFKKAHELAMKAVELGDDSARWLAAATLDRLLLTEGKAQKYGTQFKQNKKGKWELAQPIDPTVTDDERKEWNVPPLKDALNYYKQKYGIS